MGTWGGAERVVQPTDLVSGRFSCFPKELGDREEDERGTRERAQGLLEAGGKREGTTPAAVRHPGGNRIHRNGRRRGAQGLLVLKAQFALGR